MLQATVCNSGTLDVQAFGEDCLSSPEVDIGRSEVQRKQKLSLRMRRGPTSGLTHTR